VEERQARASPPRVARTEVGDRRDAGPLGDHRWVADLERRAQLGMVRDGLPVRGDRVHCVERHARGARRGGRGRGEALGEQHVERRQLAQHCAAGARGEAGGCGLQRAIEGLGVECDQTERPRVAASSGHSTSAASAPSASSGHQANHARMAAEHTGRKDGDPRLTPQSTTSELGARPKAPP
jgi:hypothetical protein